MPFEPTTTAEFLTNSSIMQKLLEQRAAQQSIAQTRQLRASPEQAQRIFQDTLRSNQAHVEALQADAAAKIAETNRARRGVGAAPTPSQVAITRTPAVAPTPAPVSRGITHSLDRAVGAIRNRLPSSAAAVAAASTASTIGSYASGQMILNDLGAGLGVGGLARNAKTILDLMRKNNDSSNADPIPQINSPTQTVLAPGSPGFQAGIGYGVYVRRNSDGNRMNAGSPFSGVGPVSWSPTLILNNQGTPILNGINLSFSNVNFGALNYTYSAQGYSAEIFRLDGQPENLAPTEVPTPTPPIIQGALPSFPEATLGNLPEVNRIPITQPPPVPSAQPVTAPLPVSEPAPDTGATPESTATPQTVPPSTQTVLDTPTAKITVDKDGNTTTTTTRLYGAAAIAAATAIGTALIVTAKPKDATSVTPIIPPGAPPPTTTPTRCPCNGPVLDGQSAINNKLDQLLGAGADVGGLAAILAKLNQMQTFAETAWNSTKLSKVIELLTLITTLHNAAMISRDVAETLGYAVSNALATVGIKDEAGNQLDVNSIVGGTVTDFIKGVVGEDVYNNTRTAWIKANRILTSASNIVWTIRSIHDSTQEVLEWTAENTGKIGNALKKWGIVGERAYPWMSENVKAQDLVRRRYQRILDGLEQAEDTASSLAMVTGETLEITQEVAELGEAKQRFTDAITDALPQDRPNNVPVQDGFVTQQQVSTAQTPTAPDFERGEAPNAP